MQPGGKAGNQAAAAARQGVRTAIVARVGDDLFGRELQSRMATVGVDTSFIQVDAGNATGASTVFAENGGEYASIIVPGAGMALSVDELSTAQGALNTCAVLLLQLETPAATSEIAARITRAAGGFVILNPSPLAEDCQQPVEPSLMEHVDLLVVNCREAQIMSQLHVKTPQDGRLAGLQMIETTGVGAAVITLGAEGAVVVTAEYWRHVAAFPTKVVDTIGAGDALTGALAAALARGEPMERALVLGAAAAALTVSGPMSG